MNGKVVAMRMLQLIKDHPDARAHVLSHKSFESFASCIRCKFLQRRESWRGRFRLDPSDQTSETWICEKFDGNGVWGLGCVACGAVGGLPGQLANGKLTCLRTNVMKRHAGLRSHLRATKQFLGKHVDEDIAAPSSQEFLDCLKNGGTTKGGGDRLPQALTDAVLSR